MDTQKNMFTPYIVHEECLSKSHAKSVCKPSILLYYLMSSHGICSKVRGDTRVQSQEQDQDQNERGMRLDPAVSRVRMSCCVRSVVMDDVQDET